MAEGDGGGVCLEDFLAPLLHPPSLVRSFVLRPESTLQATKTRPDGPPDVQTGFCRHPVDRRCIPISLTLQESHMANYGPNSLFSPRNYVSHQESPDGLSVLVYASCCRAAAVLCVTAFRAMVQQLCLHVLFSFDPLIVIPVLDELCAMLQAASHSTKAFVPRKPVNGPLNMYSIR